MKVTTLLVAVCIIQMVECPVTGPSSSSLQYYIGENATFMWNSTKEIVGVKFGLNDSSGDSCYQIIVTGHLHGTGVRYPNLSNTCAERYAGRVKWIGNPTSGHAWFTLTNLQEEDFNATYFAKIMETGNPPESYPAVYLTLLQAPTTPVPTTTPVSTTTPTATPTTAAPATTALTPTPSPPHWIVPVIVICVIVLVVVIVIIFCYCCYKGMCKCCGCKIYWCKCCWCECCWCESCMCVPFLCPKRKEEDNKTDDDQSGDVVQQESDIIRALEKWFPPGVSPTLDGAE